MDSLAINEGPPAVTLDQHDAMEWPNFSDEELEAARQVLGKPDYSFYEDGLRLEEEFAAYVGSRYALAHNNGTAAIHAALFAIGVGAGDEVIVPSYTWWGSCMPVVALNAVPVFTDIQEHSLNIDPADVERRITERTKAIMVVHMWGVPCDMDPIMALADRHNLKVIEDAAHAHGAEYRGKKVGTIGDVGCFSFQASKLLPGVEGGVLVTDCREYLEGALALGHYERLSELSEDSPYRRYAATGLGYKYRIHPATAALVRARLTRLNQLNETRNQNMGFFDQQFEQIDGFAPITGPAECKRVYYGYRVRYEAKAFGGMSTGRVVAALQAEGALAAEDRYPLQHKQAAYRDALERLSELLKRDVGHEQVSLPVTERVSQQLLSLPTLPQGSRELLDQYVLAFRKVSARWRDIPEVETTQQQREGSRALVR